jgi:membrane protease YdiL (CAAX protease family)
MIRSITSVTKIIFKLQWKPNLDIAAVAASWILVVAAFYTANIIIGPETGGGLPYFFLYAILGATIFGVGLPVYWMVIIRRRPLSDLGITTRLLGVSIVLQIVLAILQYFSTLGQSNLPPFQQLIPLIWLSLTIGFFEALFWRGWVLLRLEEAFGIIPAILLGSILYALYHVGYGMPLDEIVFLFFIGLLFAVTFRLTKNIFILWPVFQPMGQLVTLIKDQLTLPLVASLGFIDALMLMVVILWLARRYANKTSSQDCQTQIPTHA